jgi:hypothetical protein
MQLPGTHRLQHDDLRRGCHCHRIDATLMRNRDETIQGALLQFLSSYKNVELVEYEYTQTGDMYQIHTVVRSPEPLDGNDIQKMQTYVAKETGKPATVTMELVIAYTVDQETTTLP